MKPLLCNAIWRGTLSRRSIIAILIAAPFTLLLTSGAPASAQTYPTKPIRMIVPSAAGGNADIIARIAAEGMSRGLGQQVYVDNQAGGRNIPGTSIVAKAAPDGHTLMAAASTHTVNPSLYKLPYDTVRDFAPVSMIGSAPLLLVAYPGLAASNMKELIALARAKPGSINYASAGTGSPANLGAELLNTMTGIKLVHVPYKATAQGNTDTISGVVQLSFPAASSLLPFVRSGKLKALGISSLKRSPLMPDIPAIAETVPGYETRLWNSVIATGGTPRHIITRLNSELIKAVNTPDVRSKLVNAGVEIETTTPEELGAFIEAEIGKWARVIREAGIKAEE